jgi:NitT/TauT family transport system ATP-binding protein
MDEPFAALDAITRDVLHQELTRVWAERGLSIVFVTHNVREAVALGDRVLVFSPRPGRVVADFRINLPRPRTLEDHALVDKASEILAALRNAEVEMQNAE